MFLRPAEDLSAGRLVSADEDGNLGRVVIEDLAQQEHIIVCTQKMSGQLVLPQLDCRQRTSAVQLLTREAFACTHII